MIREQRPEAGRPMAGSRSVPWGGTDGYGRGGGEVIAYLIEYTLWHCIPIAKIINYIFNNFFLLFLLQMLWNCGKHPANRCARCVTNLPISIDISDPRSLASNFSLILVLIFIAKPLDFYKLSCNPFHIPVFDGTPRSVILFLFAATRSVFKSFPLGSPSGSPHFHSIHYWVRGSLCYHF